ncbi:MAG TPA: S1C family serine protease, partial [Aldersonia sp.]
MSRRWPRFQIAALSAMSLLLVGVGTACSSTESGSPPAELPPPNQLEKSAALIRPAIVSIELHASGYVIDEQGNPFNNGNPYELDGSCSGFVVNPDGYIATAGHCVDVGPEGLRDEYIQ